MTGAACLPRYAGIALGSNKTQFNGAGKLRTYIGRVVADQPSR
jgi:hypothetical protein